MTSELMVTAMQVVSGIFSRARRVDSGNVDRQEQPTSVCAVNLRRAVTNARKTCVDAFFCNRGPAPSITKGKS